MATNNSINAPLPISLIQGGTGAITANAAKSNFNIASFTTTVSSNIPNVTGDGTSYVVVFDNVITNVGSGYNNTNGDFVVPFNGLYLFTATIDFTNVSTLHTSGTIGFKGANVVWVGNPFVISSSGETCVTVSYITQIIGSDMNMDINISGGAKTVGIGTKSVFCGYLL